MQMTTKLVIQFGNKLRDLLLYDRGGEVNIPGGQAGKCFSIARKQSVEKGRAASQIPDDEERFFDWLSFMTGKEEIVQKQTQPMDE